MENPQPPKTKYPFLRTLLLIGIAPPLLFFLTIAVIEYSGFNWFCGQEGATHACSFYEYLFNSPLSGFGLLICSGLALTWVIAVLAYLRLPSIFHRPDDPRDKEVTKWKL